MWSHKTSARALTQSLPSRPALVHVCRTHAGVIRVEDDNGVDGWVDGLDACQKCLKQLG